MLTSKFIACAFALVFFTPGENAITLEDLIAEGTRHYERDDGNRHHADYYSEDGSRGSNGYNSHHHHDGEDRGKNNRHFDADSHRERGGNKHSHHDESDHSSDYYQSGKGLKSSQFGEKQGHKRGHKTKGYHNKFHKDEYHKEHKFYDNYRKSEHFSKHGDYQSNFGNGAGGQRKGGSTKHSLDDRHFGKDGHHDAGKFIDEADGHDWKQGDESHHQHHEDHGNEGNSANQKHYTYHH